MPSSAKINSTEDENKTSSTEEPTEEDTPPELEGAVGYQYPVLPLNYDSNALPEPFLISQNNYNSDFISDPDNNNVDENSNDHQYDEYAGYHRQYDQHVYVNQLPPVSERREVNTLNAQYQRTLPPHNPNPLNHRNAVPDLPPRLTRRDSVSTHRRNYSEDFSISPEELPPLPNNRTNNREFRWYPRLSTKRIPSEEIVKQEAQALLSNFTVEEFRLQKINPPQSIVQPMFSDPTWISAGKDLRMLADAFSRSRERNTVRRRAQKVNMHSITMENFFSLCSELFRGSEGISQERIVVLFTFISDIAIQHVMQGAQRFLRQLMDWSIQYIWERVCCWVRENGGWGAVMSRGANIVYHSTIFTFAALSIVALGVFLRKALFHT